MKSDTSGKKKKSDASPLKTKKKEIAIDKNSKHLLQVSSDADVKEGAFMVVAIGASSGGLEAVTLLLQNLSPDTGMAYIYVQHLSPDHKSILSSLLAKVTSMKVQVIDNMEKMEPNNVYVIPNNKNIEVVDGHIKLIPRIRNGKSNLSIDVLFSSLAETHKENVVGVILSGNAQDGTQGLKEIKSAGGITFAQDNSAKFNSMPHSAIAEGVVDFVLSPEEIAKELIWIGQHTLTQKNRAPKTPEEEVRNDNPHLKAILKLLYNKKHVDFTQYKMNTIKRRMLRRMLIHRMNQLDQYAQLLIENTEELDLLYQDLLINVTSFFRDAGAFSVLKKSILPQLLKSKLSGETLRIWIVACASGEEAYSIAMLLLELQSDEPDKIPFQIFASDLSAAAIATARAGEYSIDQLKNVSGQQMKRFFTKSKDRYRITKSLREVCVFAEHDILRNPPFSKMDLISCRNMLIYLDSSAQKKAISTFHYALNDGGTLLLGKSETIGTSEELFSPINKEFKIYIKKKKSNQQRVSSIVSSASPAQATDKSLITVNVPKKLITSKFNSLDIAFDSVLLQQYVPASVIINYDLEILQFRGATSSYLKHSAGKASFNILKMAHPEITFELRNAIHYAIKTKKTVKKSGIEIMGNRMGEPLQIVNLEVAPLKIEGEEPLLIVIFTGYYQPAPTEQLHGGNDDFLVKDRRIKKLEEELTAARADMGAITHDQQVVNEELQNANEEIVSSNEELQSLNEELETSKEEIESTNEELINSNQELHARVQEIEELYHYYEAILSTIHEPMLILDKRMRIKSVNESFLKTFKIVEEDCLGVSFYKLGNNQWNIPELRKLLEDIVTEDIRFHDFEVEDDFQQVGYKTLLINAHGIIRKSQKEELIVLTITDITDSRKMAMELQLNENRALEERIKDGEKALKKIEDSEKRYNMMLMKSPFAISILKGKEMIITLANDSMKELWGKGANIEGKAFLDVLPELADQPFPVLLDQVFTTEIPFYGNEILTRLNRNNQLEDAYFNFVYQPYLEADETVSGVAIMAYDVTDRVNAKNELVEAKQNAEMKTKMAERATRAKQEFLSNMSHEIRTPMNAIVGFTNVVLKTPLSSDQKEYIDDIKVSCDALIVLINDILDLAKVDSGKMKFEQIPFNLPKSMANMMQLFEPKIIEKNIKLVKKYDANIPAFLIGDPIRLRQIILNLMSNAVKFTSKGKITISTQLTEEDENKVTLMFSISDTGMGIPGDKLGIIFDDFQQAYSATTRMYGGTGLGLAIVKRLVELQGGAISVKSKLGRGSAFSFSLSFEKAHLMVESEANKDSESWMPFNNMDMKAIKVLVAEDMPLNQLLIKIMMSNFGFEVDVVGNGKLALEHLEKKHYDIVLMDLQMPEMDGFEATTYIREKLHSQIPIIALSADVTTVDEDRCKALGMDNYISKPINENQLFSKIMQHLRKPDKSN